MSAKAKPSAGQPKQYIPHDDLVRVGQAIPALLKISSYWRMYRSNKKIAMLGEERKQQIAERRQAQKANPEQVALTEFIIQLKAKNLTPEAFFRICDMAYARHITTDQFKAGVKRCNLRLTKTQINRLEYVFNEDGTDDITYTEYQHALEAYNVCGEAHIVGPGPKGSGYVPFEHSAIEQLVDLIKSRGMQPAELFNAINIDRSDDGISLVEFRNFISDQKQSLMEKDLQAIQKFFSQKDTDGNGTISMTEFMTLYSVAEQTATKKKINDAARAKAAEDGDEFAEAEIEEADQGMFTDAFTTVKGWFGGKKQKFANLDSVIPGYQLMSPRSKCDKACSLLIKEMQKNRVAATSVFNVADPNRTSKATVEHLRGAFIKVAPKIDQDVIADALKSFGEDSFKVEEGVFATTFNAQFDQDVNQAVPNSKHNPGASAKKARPATASATIKPDQNAQISLIKKMDNAMLRVKMSPLDAFKQADLNHNGVVTTEELKMAIKNLLPNDTFSPADIKMTMIAFDKNRNGMIDENEFISAITQARETQVLATPSGAAATMNSKTFGMDNTISSIGMADHRGDDDDEDVPTDTLILRMIFDNMKMKDIELNKLNAKHLSLLYFYWEKDESDLAQDAFLDYWLSKEDVLTENDAQQVFTALTDDFEGTVQSALDYAYGKMRQEGSSQATEERLSKVSAVKLDNQGLVSNMSVKRLVADLHYGPRGIYTKFNELHKEVTGQECSMRDFQSIFSKPQFVKTFMLNSQSLSQPQNGINGLALATNIFFQNPDSLYTNENQDSWNKIVFKYIAALYDAIDSQKSAAQIHKGMANFTKMMKGKTDLKKWIQFLDVNALRSLSSSHQQNQKCLYDKNNQERQILPPIMTKQMTVAELLKMIETGVAGFRTAAASPAASILKSPSKKLTITADDDDDFPDEEVEKATQAAAPSRTRVVKTNVTTSNVSTPNRQQQQPQRSSNAPPSTFVSNKRNKAIRDVEQAIGGPVQGPLMPFIEQTEIPGSQLAKAYATGNGKIQVDKTTVKSLMGPLCKAASNAMDKTTKNVSIGKLIRLFTEEEEVQDLTNKALMNLASSIDEPIRETIQGMLMNAEDGIHKDEWLRGFGDLREPIDKWSLVCLFYRLDIDDMADEMVQLETIVKVICTTKNVAYQKPVTFAPSIKQGKGTAARKSANTVVDETSRQVSAAAQTWVDDFAHNQAVILNGSKFPMHPKEVKPSEELKDDVGTRIQDFHVNNEVVMKSILGLYKMQKVILDPHRVKACFTKLRGWFQRFEGNDEEAASAFILKQLVDALNNNQGLNATVTEINILMCRYAFHKAKAEDGETQLLDMFELMIIMWVSVERDGFNQLEQDKEYSQRLFELAEDEFDDGEMNEMVAEAVVRLEIRVHLASLIMKEEERLNPKHLDVVNEDVWATCRFSRIIQLIGEKLQHQDLRQKFLQTFKSAHNSSLTYCKFYVLFKNVLGIINVAEWMFEDFLSALDIEDKALIELNQVATWLKEHGTDLGVTITAKEKKVHKKNMPPSTYEIIPEEDHYRGCATILNSEVAALAMCLQIEQQLEEGEQYFDMDFGPNNDEDDEGKANSMYCNGKTPQSHPAPDSVEWRRPVEYLSGANEGKKGKFLIGDASANEVKQGALGDCWFIGALSVIATEDRLLRGCADQVPEEMVNLIDAEIAGMLSMGVYPPIFHRFRKSRIFCLRFFKDSKWRYVLIDDRLPIYKGARTLVFGSCKNAEELWVPLIEKAYAKLHGCYQTLVSGFIDDGLADMTAMVCEKLQIHNRRGEFDRDSEKFWKQLEMYKESGSLMGCSVTGGTEHGVRIDGVDTGIMSGHAYSLNDVFEIPDEEMEKARKTHRMLRVRNPWGRGEWKLKWSDDSEEIDKHEDKIMQYFSTLEEEERPILGANDGTFLINYASFRDIYNRLFIVNDFPGSWSAIRFHSEWTRESSGGLPIEKTEAANKRFAKNPQFVFQADEDCEMFCSLQQSDGREVQNNKYSKYPFADRVVSTMLFLFELPDGMDSLPSYTTCPAMEKATPKVLHEISMRVELKAGKKYAIIPSPRKPGTLGHFHLSIYTSACQHEFDVVRADDPSNQYGFIAEEYDKSERKVAPWKVQWCKDNLSSMIGKEDVDLNMSKSLNKSGLQNLGKTKSKSRKAKKATTMGASDAKKAAKRSALANQLSMGVDASQIIDEDEEEPNME